ALAAPMFGERVGRREVLWTLTSLVGMAILVFGSSGIPQWSIAGDALALAAMALWTIYFLTTKRLRVRIGALEYFSGVLIASAVVITPFALLTGEVSMPSRRDLMLLILLVLLGNGGHILTTWAHRYVDVSRSAVITMAVPVISAVAALVMLSEPLAPLQILGGAVVLLGVGFAAKRTAEITEAETEAPG
ncbi:MAG: DMT family transporter, partial [Acidimicrobiia bacterium]